jgi:hypothetical protein
VTKEINGIGACIALTICTSALTHGASFFSNTGSKVASAAVAVDTAGGMHMAYVDYVPLAERPQARYLYCSAGQACGFQEQWRSVAIGNRVTEVQVAVNAAGQPRMLLRIASEQRGLEHEYHYAECDADCTNASSWKTVMVRGSYGTSVFDTSDDTSPQRYFTLDPQGRPRFVYIDRNYPIEPDHMGSYYVWCDADCTNARNWRETLFTDTTPYDFEPVRYPSLTFTRSGAPRIITNLFVLSASGQESGLYYIACDNGCDRRENWKRVYLVPRGQELNPSWDIELDQHDRPRVAFYIGSLPDNGGEHLFYLWCDEGCLNADNWYYNDPGVPSRSGRHPDLELTAGGKPRIAVMAGNSGGLGYIWCDQDCETDNPQWKGAAIETTKTLEAEFPQALPTSCDAGLWTTLTPALALDSAGNPFMAYDARYDTRCWYTDPTRPADPPSYRFTQLWSTVRGVVMTQPQ